MTREAHAPRVGRAVLAACACSIAGAAFLLARDAVEWRRPAAGVTTYRGFCAPAELLARDLNAIAPGSCLVQVPDPEWRPLQLTVRLKAREGVSPGASGPPLQPLQPLSVQPQSVQPLSVQISVNEQPIERVEVGAAAWTTRIVEVPARDRLAAATILVRLDSNADVFGSTAPPIEVAPIEVTRTWPRTRVMRTGLIGAIAGAIAWWLIAPLLRMRRSNNSSNAASSSAGSSNAVGSNAVGRSAGSRDAAVILEPLNPLGRSVAVVAGLLCLYFAIWALLRPPYQTPDEVQHHLRVSSVLRDPWVAEAGAWTLDPRFVNPLARWTPASLDKLFFDKRQRLSRQEITGLRAVPWPAPDARPPGEPYPRAIASYPTLYYVALFAIAEPLTRGLALSPYASTYAYRLVSCGLAALLWAVVYRTLRRTLATRDLAGPLVAFLVLNPMVAFMSSAINPDAVNIPLATLAVLYLWRVLVPHQTAQGDRVPVQKGDLIGAIIASIATAWTKPSGLQVLVAFALAAGALWMLRRVPFARLRLAAAVTTLTAIVIWCGFYAWSPPRFAGGPPVPDTVATYLGTRWRDLPLTWIEYWGTLGWLEYSLPAIWYQALAIAVLLGLACALIVPRIPRLFAGYTALFLAAFLLVTMAGEFAYLPAAGYFLQGRHLLPASIGLAALLLHRVRAARLALLALLIVMNVALLHETVQRYYSRGWSSVMVALPFGPGS